MKAKKSLGQNFLKSTLALNKIIEAGEISKEDTILEIGPGKGALTEKLLGKAGKVIAVEKDEELIRFLSDKFSKEVNDGSLVLVRGDILDFEISVHKLGKVGYKIIANIPYNITGAILKKFLSEKYQPSLMVLMVQHEVAKRIMGKNPASPRLRRAKESLLSISVKAYGTPKMIMKVPSRYFSPAPKVDSAVIKISNISKKLFEDGKGGGDPSALPSALSEEIFWQIVRAGFAHKRKILASNLKNFNKKIDWEYIFNKIKIGKKARAEDLSVTDWINLTSFIQKDI